ncbi:MAG: Gfo/Idh/MocA family oxidoreductase [Anaerolineae bacterium]|nr:Gfo/Idh/MocA family oxidoreductase [Anaerolineae bacterium]
MTTAGRRPIRLALIGAGIFARDAHVPALLELGEAFEVTVVCSRTAESAARLNALLPRPADVVHDIDAVLARDDVDAVDVLLPIHLIPGAVEKALAAGKHVISEKPMAPDVASGRHLLGVYARHPELVYVVAENYRFEPPFLTAAEIVASGEIGVVRTAHWSIHVQMRADNKHYHTAWRHTEQHPGGFVMDGGVHQIAVFRLVVGEIDVVSAITTHTRTDLPAPDSLVSALHFATGAVGSWLLTYTTGAPWFGPLEVVGSEGALRVWEHAVEVTSGGETRHIAAPRYQGVREELAAFAAAINDGAPHISGPGQGLQDVAVIEAMLKSGQTGQRVAVERILA